MDDADIDDRLQIGCVAPRRKLVGGIRQESGGRCPRMLVACNDPEVEPSRLRSLPKRIHKDDIALGRGQHHREVRLVASEGLFPHWRVHSGTSPRTRTNASAASLWTVAPRTRASARIASVERSSGNCFFWDRYSSKAATLLSRVELMST